MLELREVTAEGPELDVFRELIQEYQRFLGIDLCFQGFHTEVAEPFGRYGPPRGLVLLAYWDGKIAGCGALHDLGDGECELKRIYVRPAFRRKGIARKISDYLVDRAVEIGYQKAKLDTLRRLEGAGELYASMGFVETVPYNFNPESDIVYMERSLEKSAKR